MIQMMNTTEMSKRKSAGIHAMIIAGLIGAAGAAAQGLPGWTKQKKIVMNTTATGANVAEEVKGFPVPITLDAANFDFASAKADGSDLRFTDASGAALPFEIESWDVTGKKAAVWVRADVKGNDAQQFITMHWGNAAASNESLGAKVFDKAGGWAGVWHLAEKGATAAGTYKDATENASTGQGVKAVPGTAAGRVGSAVDLAQGAYVRIENSGSKPVFNLTSTATYSVWAKPRSHTINYQAIFTKGETGFRIHYYGLPNWPDNTDPATKVQKNITEPCIESPGGGDFCPVEGVAKPGDSQGTAWKGVDVKPGEWFLLVAVLDRKDVKYYINGAHRVTWTGSGTWASGSEPVCIGNNADRSRAFDGILDEARIQNVVRDLNWIKLDYESQKDGSTFLNLSAPTSMPGKGLTALAKGSAGPKTFDLHGRQLSGGKAPAGVYLEKLMVSDREFVLRKRARLP